MRLQTAAILATVLLALACLTEAKPNKEKQEQSKSTETINNDVPDVIPTGYAVTLDPGAKAKDNLTSPDNYLCGNVIVNITCRKPTDKVVLQFNRNLTIIPESAKLTSTLTGDLAITVIQLDPSGSPQVILTLPKKLTPDHAYQLRLRFNGRIPALDGSAGWNAALYIEAGKAADFFPCFNDPVFKVPIDLKLARPKNMTILAPTACKNTTPVNGRDGWVWDELQTTMPVSMQYFTVLISDLKLVNETVVSPNNKLSVLDGTQSRPEGVTVGVWGRVQFKNALLWASSAAPFIVCSLQCIVGTQLPAARLDIIALPIHHGPPVIGQGLLVYRESGIQNVTAEGAALHIARGAASQFFGVLLTPETPKDARINSAMVNYLATEAVRQAIDRDYLPNAVYSLYYELGSQFPFAGVNAAQRQNIEGNKAELVLRMLSITMGEKTMGAARLQLLEEKLFRTYTADQLWEMVTTHARSAGALPEKLAVKDIINSWMCRNRVPLLQVTRNYETLSAELKQSVFHRYPDPDVETANTTETKAVNVSSPGECEEDSPWILPVVALGAGQPFQRADQPPRLWMTEGSALLANCSSNDEFLLVNPAETAPYVVDYDKRNWELLAAALNGSVKATNATTIDVLSRAKLVHDALLLGRAGRLPLSTAMTVVRTLETELYPSVWRPVGNVLDQLGRDIDGTRLEEKFNAFLNKLLTKALANLQEVVSKSATTPAPPSNGSAPQVQRLSETRTLILHQLRRVTQDPCGERAYEAFKAWNATDDPDLGTPISDGLLCCLFQYGNNIAWEFGLERLKRFPPHRLPSERDFLIKSLAGCPRSPDRKRKILTFVILENNGTFSEADQRLVLKAASSWGHDVLTFLIDNWDVLKTKYEKRPPMWESLVVRATSNLKTRQELDMLKKLYEEKKGQWGSSESLVTSALERTKQSLKWGDAAFPDLEPWIDSYLGTNSTTANA